MILEKLKEIIHEQLGVDVGRIDENSDIVKDIGADSLDIVEMLMNVESEWGVTIDDEDIASVKTVGDVIRCIEKKLNK